MQTTLFPNRAESISERIADFIDHLRMNGLNIGSAETEASLQAMTRINVLDPNETFLALRSICANDAERFDKFETLFNSYWFNRGRTQTRETKKSDKPGHKNQWTNRSVLDNSAYSGTSGEQDTPDDDPEGESQQSGDGKLIASKITNINKSDLREFMKPEDLEKAEMVAAKIANAIRDRRSRRRRSSKRGADLDMRKIAQKSVRYGGEPFRLLKKQRPDRPVRLVALLDVSGSMTVYARVFLAFLKGLISADQHTDAYLFHTQLVRISDALRDGDTFRAVNRLSIMAQGFGGGTKIGTNIKNFNDQYAAKTVNGRTVVIILSDGYDTDPPNKIETELARLKKRRCKIIWLNPLKGWRDYQPVARGMAAALPYLDYFEPANTLDNLAALEPHLARL